MILQATHSEKLKWASYGILLIASIFSFLRCWFYEPISDDLIYQFFLDEEFGTKYYTRHVESLGDVLQSQANEYTAHSGRFLVHTLVQMFSGIWGRGWYSFANSIVYLITLLLIVRYSTAKNKNIFFVWATVVAVSCAYFIPTSMAASIAGSLNYIWPVPIVILFLMSFHKFMLSERIITFRASCFIAPVLGFITGSTQETYVLPLCIVTFLVVCRQLFKRVPIPTPLFLLCLSLWIGGGILGLAPGTLNRGASVGGSSIIYIWQGLKMMAMQPYLWLAIVLSILCAVQKKNLRIVLKKFWMEYSILGCSFVFTIFAHTLNQSYSGVQVFSILLVARLLGMLSPESISRNLRIIMIVSATFVFSLFCIHQVIVIDNDIMLSKTNHDLIERYISSPDGIVEYEEVDVSPWARIYVRDFNKDLRDSEYAWWKRYTVQVAYGNKEKKLFILNKNDLQLLSTGIGGLHIRAVKGDAGFYRIGNYLMAYNDSLKSKDDTIAISYKNCQTPGWRHKMMCKLLNRGSDIITEWTTIVAVDSLELIKSRWGDYRMIPLSHSKIVESVDLK